VYFLRSLCRLRSLTLGWLIYVIMTLGAFAGISGPAMQSYITKHVPANEQGAVQGVYAGLASLAGIPGPFIATWSLAGRSLRTTAFICPASHFLKRPHSSSWPWFWRCAASARMRCITCLCRKRGPLVESRKFLAVRFPSVGVICRHMFPRSLFAFSLLAIASARAEAPPPASAPVQSAALSRLEKSPRHQEWVDIKGGDRTVHTFVVYPEVKDKAMVVVVIHENRGLNDWARSVADRLAENGYIAVAPDLLSGTAPGGGNTKDFPTQGAATEAIGKLPADQVLADLNAVADYAKKLPSASGKLAVVGFCWGGGKSWAFAVAPSRPGAGECFLWHSALRRRGLREHPLPGVRLLRRQRCPGKRDDREIHRRDEGGRQGLSTRDLRRSRPRLHAVGRRRGCRPGQQKAMTEGWQRLLAALAKAKG